MSNSAAAVQLSWLCFTPSKLPSGSNQRKRETKGKDQNRYQERKAGVQRKLRADEQQQLESMRVELKAANSKEIPGSSSSQLFQPVKSMTGEFQSCLQGIQSATDGKFD